MGPTSCRLRTRTGAIGLSLAFSLSMFFAAIPAEAGTEPTTLQVSLDNGTSAVTAGDTVTYILTVQSESSSAAKDLLLTQNIPVTLEFVQADPGGTATSGTVSWYFDLEPHATLTFRTVMTVLAAPTDSDQVASVACVAAAVDAQPRACATDADQLTGAQNATGGDPPTHQGLWWPVSLTIAVLTVITIGAVRLVRRHRVGEPG